MSDAYRDAILFTLFFLLIRLSSVDQNLPLARDIVVDDVVSMLICFPDILFHQRNIWLDLFTGLPFFVCWCMRLHS